MIVARAPLRIPLGGGGTDFPSYYLKYGGYTLGLAITKYVHVVIHDTIDGKIRLKYSKNEVVDKLEDLDNRIAAEALKDYGVTQGIEIVTFADVPECSGLGGSSAFCVALVVALRHKLGLSMKKREIFQSAWNIERVQANQPGGIQDQLFATYGGAWSARLGTTDHPELRPVDLGELLPRLKLVYTNTQRTNLEIAVRQTVGIQEKDSSILGSLDFTKRLGMEIEECIRFGRLDKIGNLFHTHWMSKKSRSDLISNPDLDTIYRKARKCGATGGKLLGLGGGGYFLFYVPDQLLGFETIDVQVDTEGAKVVYST